MYNLNHGREKNIKQMTAAAWRQGKASIGRGNRSGFFTGTCIVIAGQQWAFNKIPQ